MNDPLTDENIEGAREVAETMCGQGAGDHEHWPHEWLLRLLDRYDEVKEECDRYRETLDQIRDITDPETETAQPPMSAIREVLEDTNE